MNRTLIACVLGSLLVACQPGKQETTSYTDTRALIENAITRLSAKHATLHKVLVFGDSSVTQELSVVNWKEELRPFTEIDMRKKAYKGRYKVDTTENSTDRYTLEYTPLDAQTDVHVLTITLNKNDGSLHSLKASYAADNTLYNAEKELTFYNDSLFTITGSQEVRLGNTLKYAVTGVINAGR